jgi:hypothetical protein
VSAAGAEQQLGETDPAAAKALAALLGNGLK